MFKLQCYYDFSWEKFDKFIREALVFCFFLILSLPGPRPAAYACGLRAWTQPPPTIFIFLCSHLHSLVLLHSHSHDTSRAGFLPLSLGFALWHPLRRFRGFRPAWLPWDRCIFLSFHDCRLSRQLPSRPTPAALPVSVPDAEALFFLSHMPACFSLCQLTSSWALSLAPTSWWRLLIFRISRGCRQPTPPLRLARTSAAPRMPHGAIYYDFRT